MDLFVCSGVIAAVVHQVSVVTRNVIILTVTRQENVSNVLPFPQLLEGQGSFFFTMQLIIVILLSVRFAWKKLNEVKERKVECRQNSLFSSPSIKSQLHFKTCMVWLRLDEDFTEIFNFISPGLTCALDVAREAQSLLSHHGENSHVTICNPVNN